MLNLLALLFRQDRRTRQYKLSETVSVINTMANRIPKARCILPFIDEPRRVTFYQTTDLRLRKCQILVATIRVIQIQDAFSHLFTGCCLPTPFGSLNDNSACRFQPFSKNAISNPIFILLTHLARIISKIAPIRQCHSAVWTKSIRQFGPSQFGSLDQHQPRIILRGCDQEESARSKSSCVCPCFHKDF